MSLFLVMLGGTFGSGLRYLAGRAGLALLGPGFPWGTAFVNLSGGLGMGLLVGTLARHPSALSEPARLLVGVGVLGGFTTFSSFSLETVTMIERGEIATAALYVAGSAAGAILLLFAGLSIARALPA